MNYEKILESLNKTKIEYKELFFKVDLEFSNFRKIFEEKEVIVGTNKEIYFDENCFKIEYFNICIY